MQVTEFLQKLNNGNGQPLLFEYADGQVVQGGYHITEIKNAGFETIDCGNSLHAWKEVVVQVWEPAEAQASAPWMPTGKFLKIWDVVDSRLALHQDSEIRIEYGNATHLTSLYHVDDIVATEDGLVVKMAPPRTMCKPREILIAANEMSETAVAESCCASVGRIETVTPLAVANGATREAAVCCSSSSADVAVSPVADSVILEVHGTKATAVKGRVCC